MVKLGKLSASILLISLSAASKWCQLLLSFPCSWLQTIAGRTMSQDQGGEEKEAPDSLPVLPQIWLQPSPSPSAIRLYGHFQRCPDAPGPTPQLWTSPTPDRQLPRRLPPDGFLGLPGRGRRLPRPSRPRPTTPSPSLSLSLCYIPKMDRAQDLPRPRLQTSSRWLRTSSRWLRTPVVQLAPGSVSATSGFFPRRLPAQPPPSASALSSAADHGGSQLGLNSQLNFPLGLNSQLGLGRLGSELCRRPRRLPARPQLPAWPSSLASV